MLQFVREIPLRIVIEEASSVRRGFLFYVSAGFFKPINPLSGMSADLVQVDSWLALLKADLEKDVLVCEADCSTHAFAELMAKARLNLHKKAESDGTQLISLEFREERAWSFSWHHGQPAEELSFKYLHFLEAFPKSLKDFDLLKIEFNWKRVQACKGDFRHEGFKILKDVAPKNHVELRDQLQKHIGHQTEGGSVLKSISIEYLSSGYTIGLS